MIKPSSAGRKSPSRDFVVIWGLCAGFGIAVWAAAFAAAIIPGGLFGNSLYAPGTDFAVFYTAAREALSGNLARLYDGGELTAELNHNLAGWLSAPLPFHPWVYPPSFLTVVTPFGLLSFGTAYFAFEALSIAALTAALWCAVRQNRSWAVTLALLSPAGAMTAVMGQNAFLFAALAIGGLALLDARPLAAGLLLGLASFKPQLWPLVPIALAAGRHWRALAAACGAAFALAAISAVAFGTGLWLDWVRLVIHPPASFSQAWLATGRLGQSIYAGAIEFGAPDWAADTVQALAALGSATLVAWGFRRGVSRGARLFVFFAAAMIAAPHAAGYDAVGIASAAAVLALDINEARTLWRLALPSIWIFAPLADPAATPVMAAFPLALAAAAGLCVRQFPRKTPTPTRL